MAKKIIKARLKQRTDTQANWAANNPVLLEGELGLVTDDKNLYKVGDGVTAWNDLPFRGFDGTLVHETGDSDSAAMSQRGVTQALAKLEESMANNEKELSGKIEQLAEENTRLKERIEEQDVFIEDLEYHKLTANSDNRYPDLSVGTADNLAGVDVVDSEFNFRRSGGGAITDGVARIEAIKGNSVVWSQMVDNAATALFKNGNTNGVLSVEGDTITLTATTAGSIYAYYRTQPFMDSLIVGHKYLRISEMRKSSNALAYARMQGIKGDSDTSISTNDTWSVVSNIFTITEKTSASPFFQFINMSAAVGDYISFRKTTFVDLTKMFGSGNEPTTIEEFYQRAPMGVDLNAYNVGEVIHMDVQSIESVGVNQWDEEATLGLLQPDGTIGPATARLTTSMLPVIGGKAYFFRTPSTYTIAGRQAFYDKDFNLVRYDGDGARPNTEFVAPANASYMRYCFAGAYGATYNHDICINLSDAAINGKYFPYIKRQEDLAVIRKYFPDGMKSAGSAHDAIRYNKTAQKREYSKGRMKEVDLGSLTFSEWQDGMYAANLADMAIKGQILCAKYSTDTYTNVTAKNTGIAALTDKGGIVIYDAAYTTPSAIKTALKGIILYYEAAEWEWVELDKEDQLKDWDYSVWNDGTEKAIAEGKSAPLAADITYGFNAVGKIKELEGLVAQLRAKVGI